MPVKFGQASIRFWFFLSYLITTVLEVEGSLPLSGLPVPPLLWLLEGPPIPICVPKLMPNPIALELF